MGLRGRGGPLRSGSRRTGTQGTSQMKVREATGVTNSLCFHYSCCHRSRPRTCFFTRKTSARTPALGTVPGAWSSLLVVIATYSGCLISACLLLSSPKKVFIFLDQEGAAAGSRVTQGHSDLPRGFQNLFFQPRLALTPSPRPFWFPGA